MTWKGCHLPFQTEEEIERIVNMPEEDKPQSAERPITLRWIDLQGKEHEFQSTDDKAILDKGQELFMLYVTSKIRHFSIIN